MKIAILTVKIAMMVSLVLGTATLMFHLLKPLVKTSVRYYAGQVGVYDLEAPRRRPKDMTLNPGKYRKEALNWEPQ